MLTPAPLYSDSRKRIQKTIDRILKDPNSYAPYVVRNVSLHLPLGLQNIYVYN